MSRTLGCGATHMLGFMLMFIHGLWRDTTGNFGVTVVCERVEYDDACESKKTNT